MDKTWDDTMWKAADKLLAEARLQMDKAAELKDRYVSVRITDSSMSMDVMPFNNDEVTENTFHVGDRIIAHRPTNGTGVNLLGNVIHTFEYEGTSFVAYKIAGGFADKNPMYSCDPVDRVVLES